MRTRTQRGIAIALTGILLLSGCADGAQEEAPSEDAAASEQAPVQDSAPESTSPSRVALPGLFSIMVGLQEDMARVSRGLWLERFDTIAAAAQDVADHPRVPPEEFERISGVLGKDMSRFGGMDMEVHDLAVRLAEAAREEDLEAVLSAQAELRRACVACHSTFRQRLRDGIR